VFYGTALHRATATELERANIRRFVYNSNNGPDFYDTHTKRFVELTTGAQVGAHVGRDGSYPTASYVVYDIVITVGLR
jgi:hypothetical protein